MGICISGLKMPEPGERLSIDIDSTGKVSVNLDLECRQIGTASQVPPHGRLIDADALAVELGKQIAKHDELMKVCKNAGDMKDYFDISKIQTGMVALLRMLNSAPTVIPEEKGE